MNRRVMGSRAAVVFAWMFFLGAFTLLPRAGLAQTVPEKLVYELSWTGIPIGTATQEISEEGELHRIVSTARSNDWLSVFFPVNDRIESTLESAGAPFPGLTRHYRMQMSEGRHSRDREIDFDQAKGIAVYHDRRSNERRLETSHHTMPSRFRSAKECGEMSGTAHAG